VLGSIVRERAALRRGGCLVLAWKRPVRHASGASDTAAPLPPSCAAPSLQGVRRLAKGAAFLPWSTPTRSTSG